MYVVDVVIRRRTELVCSAASVLSFRSDPYSELLKESQQVVWLATCKKIEIYTILLTFIIMVWIQLVLALRRNNVIILIH